MSLRDEVNRAINRHLAKRPPIDDIKVTPTHPEPSAIDRLSALVDDDAKARVKDYENDIKAGRVSFNVTVKPKRPADYIVIDFTVDPDSMTNANEEAHE